MVLKKNLLFLVALFLFSGFAHGQVIGVKTNALMDGLKIINVGAEIGLDKKTTLDLYADYNPWKESQYKMYKVLAFQPEIRHWFCDRFNGHFVGLHLHGGWFQTAGVKLPFGLYSFLNDYRYKGNFYGGGISYGYQWIVSKRFNIEANVGVGYARIHYEKYPCIECGDKLDEGNANYFGLTKAAISLIYFIH
jgi:hypothetical protein